MSPWSKFRYQAGVLHVLDKASEDGHCYLPESRIIPFTKELLTTDEHKAEENAIAGILSEMVAEQQLVKELDEEIIGVAQLGDDSCSYYFFLNYKKLRAKSLELRATNRNIKYVIP